MEGAGSERLTPPLRAGVLAAIVTLNGFTGGRTVDLGGLGEPNGMLTISQGDLNTITTDIVRVGNLVSQLFGL